MACLYFIALWSRLGNRKRFSIALDNYSKKYIWGLICKNESIQMFLLQEPRPPLDHYNRYDYVDPEFEVICEPVSSLFVLTILWFLQESAKLRFLPLLNKSFLLILIGRASCWYLPCSSYWWKWHSGFMLYFQDQDKCYCWSKTHAIGGNPFYVNFCNYCVNKKFSSSLSIFYFFLGMEKD